MSKPGKLSVETSLALYLNSDEPMKRRSIRGPAKELWNRLEKLRRKKKARSMNALVVALLMRELDAEGIAHE